jgi:glycine dehydrogenase
MLSSGIRTPKEQHLPVNLSGSQDRAGSDASGKRWATHPPTGKARRHRWVNLSGAR